MSTLPPKPTKFDRATNLEPAPARPPTLYAPAPQPPARSSGQANPQAPSSKRKAPTHGNFLGYYSKRPRTEGGDERLQLVPREWVAGKRALDVGCNSGVVTVELGQAFGAGEAIGVDIDEQLVSLANKHTTLCWSRQTPLPSLLRAAENVPTPGRDAPPHQKSVSATSSPAPDATNDPATPPVPNYFPLAFPRCYGYLPQPPSELLRADHCKAAKAETMDGTSMPEGGREFPGNVMFRVADWAKDGIEEDEGLYDIIFAFSITKWIHLNHLNPGLLAFFHRLHRSLRPGGRLILEPQPFASYKDSARLSDQLRANYEVLRDGDGDGVKGWREEEGEFERVLLGEVGFERRERLGETGEKGFHRPVDVYYKREAGGVE